MFPMLCASLKCKMLFQDWIGSKRDLVLSGEEVDEVGIYYLGSCISPSGPVLD